MSVKTYDFIIGYENKVRELESACLLKMELEKRGYSVLLFQEFDQRYDDIMEVIYHAKVLVLSCGYADSYVETFVRRFMTFDKLVNWQWEQVFGKSWESDPDASCAVHGDICRQAVQLSWGKRNFRRMTDSIGLPKENVFVTGDVAMDFLKGPFRKMYLSRHELFEKYSIPQNKKVAVLMGAFSRAFRTEKELCDLEKETGRDVHEEAARNLKKFYAVMEWIRQALKEDEELFFVYRPHPGEEYERCRPDIQEYLDEIKAETGRFITLQELSARQWIVACDKIYMGFSTTAVDAYFAHKGCYIVSPGGVYADTTALFDGATIIDGYEDFISSVKSDEFTAPLDEKMIDEYFTIGDEMSYLKVADVLEEVKAADRFVIDTSALWDKIKKNTDKELSGKSFAKKLKLKLWKYDWFYKLYWWFMSIPVPIGYFVRQRQYKARIDEYYKGYVGSREEILDIENRLRRCLKGN